MIDFIDPRQKKKKSLIHWFSNKTIKQTKKKELDIKFIFAQETVPSV